MNKPVSRHPSSSFASRRSARGFTVIELGIVLIIIVLLVSIVGTAAARVFLSARSAGERQMLISLRVAIEQFKQQHGFLPPLLKDDNDATYGPVTSSGTNLTPSAFLTSDLSSVANTSHVRYRYSLYSLSFYVVGATDAVIDGVDGPGYTAPKADGTFTKQGRTYPALFDPSANTSRMARLKAQPVNGVVVDSSQFATSADKSFGTLIVILDRWKNPVRYYRWEPSFYTKGRDTLPPGKSWGDIKDYNVPAFLGDPVANPDLRNARYALVSAGPDGIIVDDPMDSTYPGAARPDSPQNKDNIVEFGQ